MPVMDGVAATRALEAGARGYVLKDTIRTELLQLIRGVMRAS